MSDYYSKYVMSEEQKQCLYRGVLAVLPDQLSLESQAALAMTVVQMAQDECTLLASKGQKAFAEVIKATGGI